MKNEEMKYEIAEAIERNGLAKNYIASQIGCTPSAISYLLSLDHDIPLNLLSDLTKFLDDFKLKCKAVEFFADFDLMPEINYIDMPQQEFFSSVKEEHDRKKLENDDFNLIMSKPVEEWDDEDIAFMKSYRKELYEEAVQEFSYLAALENSLKMVGV